MQARWADYWANVLFNGHAYSWLFSSVYFHAFLQSTQSRISYHAAGCVWLLFSLYILRCVHSEQKVSRLLSGLLVNGQCIHWLLPQIRSCVDTGVRGQSGSYISPTTTGYLQSDQSHEDCSISRYFDCHLHVKRVGFFCDIVSVSNIHAGLF